MPDTLSGRKRSDRSSRTVPFANLLAEWLDVRLLPEPGDDSQAGHPSPLSMSTENDPSEVHDVLATHAQTGGHAGRRAAPPYPKITPLPRGEQPHKAPAGWPDP